MAIAVTPQIYESFKGIRELNGVNSGGEISATVCQNVELVQTEIGSGTGIKTMDGNGTLYNLPAGSVIRGIFKSVQEGRTYRFIYAEKLNNNNQEEGILYYINALRQLTPIVTGLTATGECNGITMTSTAYDVFVFTNGEEVKTVCFTNDVAYGDTVKTISAADYDGRSIKWLSMTEWNGFLVVASQYGVHASHQNDIYTWDDNPEDVADSWHIDFSKKVTAVYSYTGGLYIFTGDDVSFLNASPNNTNSSMQTMAGVGCYSYTSIIKHDIYLFFYDDNQKNIYYIQNIDSGQLRPAGPVAREIQSKFNHIERFKMYSCIYENRNEIWCIINDEIYIYNYVQSEWVQRVEQKINTVCLIDNNVLTGGANGKVYCENMNTYFDGAFIPAEYKTTFMNFGSNSNLKKQKTPLLLVLNDQYVNHFFVELTVDNKPKNPKEVWLKGSGGGVYGDDSEPEVLPDNQEFDVAVYAEDSKYAQRVVEISTPQTWYTLSVRFLTQKPGEATPNEPRGFYINSMELKNVKEKLKTRGR